MKTPKWTKADAKRAKKMGWLLQYDRFGKLHIRPIPFGRFKSDNEAIKHVLHHLMEKSAQLGPWVLDVNLPNETNTCIKALFLCAKG